MTLFYFIFYHIVILLCNTILFYHRALYHFSTFKKFCFKCIHLNQSMDYNRHSVITINQKALKHLLLGFMGH